MAKIVLMHLEVRSDCYQHAHSQILVLMLMTTSSLEWRVLCTNRRVSWLRQRDSDCVSDKSYFSIISLTHSHSACINCTHARTDTRVLNKYEYPDAECSEWKWECEKFDVAFDRFSSHYLFAFFVSSKMCPQPDGGICPRQSCDWCECRTHKTFSLPFFLVRIFILLNAEKPLFLCTLSVLEPKQKCHEESFTTKNGVSCLIRTYHESSMNVRTPRASWPLHARRNIYEVQIAFSLAINQIVRRWRWDEDLLECIACQRR